MKFQELVILLPCHSLEDFPVYSEGEEAEGLLAGWTAMWHPALIHSAQALPTWCRLDEPPEQLESRLLVIPPASHMELPTGFVQRAKEAGGCPVRRKLSRQEIVDAALEALDDAPEFDDEFVRDLFALSYAYLQVQILTRQMRYASNLDEIHFANQAVAAVNAAAGGDRQQAEEKLTACFDLLSEERDLFYSVDSFLIDLVMLAPTTLGPRLRQELEQPVPVNLLLSADVLDEIQRRPELQSQLRDAWEQGRIGVIACDAGEAPLPLLPIETAARGLRQGRDQAAEVLGRRPVVFGRRRYGLTPAVPQLLQKLGVRAALHATLEEGRFPEGAQIKTQWEGGDRTAVDALAKAPLNASRAETFLGLALKLGETMDVDHVATLMLARWPGGASPYLEDLRRASRRTAALGKFVSVESYFEDTDEPNQSDRFAPSHCRSPYLRQAIVRRHRDPISRWTRFHRCRAEAEAAHTLQCLASFIDRRPRDGGERALQAWDESCGGAGPEPGQGDAGPAGAEPAPSPVESAQQAAAALELTGGEQGAMIWNPHAAVRRVCVELPGWSSPPGVEKPVYAAAAVDQGAVAVVDVPPLGYAYLAPGAPSRRREPPLAEDGVLRNEFMEVMVNEATGGVGSVMSYQTRGNRLSQQVAMRIPGEPGQRASYSTMRCEGIETLPSSPVRGAVRTTAKLLDSDSQVLADVRQTLTITRGSRVLRMDIEIEPRAELRSDPWNSYFASRFAWRDEASSVACDVNQQRHSMGDRRRLEAVRYIELDNGAEATTIFPLGLPYHRRVGLSSLDTLLLVRGESARRFQLAVGVDVPYPLQEAEALLAPPVTIERTAAPQHAAAWLFHLQARNVLATHWAPLPGDDGRVRGFQARLLESSGRGAQVKLQALRPLQWARLVDLDGNVLSECRVEDGAAHLELSAREWLVVEAGWDA